MGGGSSRLCRHVDTVHAANAQSTRRPLTKLRQITTANSSPHDSDGLRPSSPEPYYRPLRRTAHFRNVSSASDCSISSVNFTTTEEVSSASDYDSSFSSPPSRSARRTPRKLVVVPLEIEKVDDLSVLEEAVLLFADKSSIPNDTSANHRSFSDSEAPSSLDLRRRYRAACSSKNGSRDRKRKARMFGPQAYRLWASVPPTRRCGLQIHDNREYRAILKSSLHAFRTSQSVQLTQHRTSADALRRVFFAPFDVPSIHVTHSCARTRSASSLL